MDTLVHWEVPHFSRGLCCEIQAILARTRIFASHSGWLLKDTVLPVIHDQKILIKSNRDSVLPNRRQAAGCECERKFPQRRKLVPLFRRISQDPFDRACFII